jgi:Tol biopolymer transport system component
MSLTSGTRIGPYEIVSALGAGGMGEVYRARDTKLTREVALKVLPGPLAGDPDRLARFRREAQVLASLNHPNIAHLYGFEDAGDAHALVMELVEGPTLADRIAAGPIPLADAIPIARQIAEALESAHEHGIIHRDLKPANIQLGPDCAVKVLDFGLAKAAQNTFVGDAAASPTFTMGATEAGVILGTAAYMAPEQASGRSVDRRADIWSFGVVLWEMLSGRRLFDGETVSHTLADVLRADIDLARLPPSTPVPIRDLLRRCLDRNAKTRLQSIGEARIALQAFLADPSAMPTPGPAVHGAAAGSRHRILPWVVAAGATAALVSLAVVHLREEATPVGPYRFEIPQPADVALSPYDRPMISPDGRTLVFTGSSRGKRQLFVRRMDSLQTTALTGTDGAAAPFWSPDGRYIGFTADGKLKKVEAGRGPVQVLCDTQLAFAGTWSRGGVIVFGPAVGQPLHQVSAAGGTPTPVLKLDESRRERVQLWPHFLPDGRHYVFTSLSTDPARSAIYIGALGSSDTRMLVNSESNASIVPPGFLLFGRGQVLMSQRLDLASLQLSGDEHPVVDGVARVNLGAVTNFSSSDNGVLAYRPEASSTADLVWYDRHGKRLGAVGEPRPYVQFTLSPDEKRVATQITDLRGGTADIWVLELVSGILSRITSDPAGEDGAAWSPDGREIHYSSVRRGRSNLYRKLVGGGDEQVILTSEEARFAEVWAGDGSFLFISQNGRSFYRLPAGNGATPEPLLTTEYSKDEPRLSPDGRWVAYNTDESGRWEVYIAAFPSFTDRRQVSNSGGVQGYWREDGRELFYLSLDGTMMSVPITPGPTLEPGVPQVLFPTRVVTSATRDQFAATGNGQRFLLLEPTEAGPRPFVVLVNWPATLTH